MKLLFDKQFYIYIYLHNFPLNNLQESIHLNIISQLIS